jgi:signal transduction histidine kinase/ABC-type multidrug transport system ATPase subunit
MAMTTTDEVRPAGQVSAPLLRVQRLSVSYGHLNVLNGIDFDVWPGQLVALTGENGAGKSTLVRCIAGDILPNSGEVLIGGARVRTNAGAAASGLAVVWQDAAMCDNLGVAENLFLGRERSRVFLSEARTTVDANRVLATFGIKLSDVRTVSSLSTGQRQLLAVARAMETEPRILVLDEPTASLGVQEARQVEQLIERLKARGTTVVLVSHDIEQVFHLADRILVLHRGKVAADLAPGETHPADVVAIMSGHAPDASARHQLSRLQDLVDQLASARSSSSLPLILSALTSAVSVEQMCIHLLEEGSLRLVAAAGLPADALAAWALVPVGQQGGPMGEVAVTGRPLVSEDVGGSPAWSRFAGLARRAGIRSSWAVPLIGPSGLIGVITGCQPFVGQPHRDEMDLVSLYAGYAAGAIDRDRLFGEVTARNRVLETIREVLETLAGPEPVSTGLLLALQSLQRGLRAAEIELWLKPPDKAARCSAYVGRDNRAQHDPQGRDGSLAGRAFSVPAFGGPRPLGEVGGASVIGTTFDAPGGQAALVARWEQAEVPDDAVALLGDAANSVRLALERDEAEQAHQQAAALRRSHQLQRDFLSRLSHELRTPLTAIRGYASSLLASDVTWDDESKLRFLNRIASESARLGRLVGDLLDFSAIESGLLRLQHDWCDLPLVIEAAVALLPPERTGDITVSCPPAISPLWADHDRLEQVFVNLLDNALRHNAVGVRAWVEVEVGAEGTVSIRVTDNGKGIPDELRPQLFVSQVRGPTSAPGAGLGLSITRGIVLAHGGRIALEPSRHGASFLIELPLEGPGENGA